jgi:hypothetical protein
LYAIIIPTMPAIAAVVGGIPGEQGTVQGVGPGSDEVDDEKVADLEVAEWILHMFVFFQAVYWLRRRATPPPLERA